MRLNEYSGFPFPALQRGPQGCLLYTRDNTSELVKSSVLQILMTSKGERPWNPEFGCDVQKFLFETDNAGNSDTIRSLVVEALQRWEPRIKVTVNDVEVVQSLDAGQIDLVINYKIVTTTTPKNESLTLTF